MINSILHMTFKLFCYCVFGLKTSLLCPIYTLSLWASFQYVTKVCKPIVVFRFYSYTVACPPVCGDNPQALASGLFRYRWTTMVYLFCTTNISVDLAHHEIFGKVGKVGNNSVMSLPDAWRQMIKYTY